MITGLAITHLLTGLGRAVHLRHKASLWWVHLVWTATVFVYLSIHWWNLYFSQSDATWLYPEFVYLLLHSALPFFAAVLLYRPDADGAPDMRATFESNRRWFLGVWALTLAADIPTTAIQGNLFSPWYYLPVIGHLIGLSLVGIWTANARYQQFLCVYMFAVTFGWGVVVRALLPGSG